MKKATDRICIYPKDVQIITGKSYRQSVRILEKIRQFYKKEKHSYVTVNEFCLYCGFDIEDIQPMLMN